MKFLKLIAFLSQKTLVTPDFGLSDLWHHHIPLKYFLFKSINSQSWPFWSKDLGFGLPILAQGEIGTFSIFNLFYFFCPFTLAFNLSYLLAILISLSGSFLLAKSLKLNHPAAILSAIVFSFSGWFVCQTSHPNFFQAASLLPLTFFLFKKALEGQKRYFFILAPVLSQQIFTGAFQITFLTIFLLFSYFIFYLFTNKSAKKPYLQLFFVFFLTFSCSLVQLAPSWQYLTNSARNKGLLFEQVTAFPYPYKHLITFINPYLFGNPAIGNYPPFSSQWGIFWENTAYLGIPPLLLAFFSLFKKKKAKEQFFFYFLAILTLILAFGKYSPLQFVFAFPPFNFFRVPSRFLLLTSFALAFLAGFGLSWYPEPQDQSRNEKSLPKTSCQVKGKLFYLLVFLLVFAFSIYNLVDFALGYLPVGKSQKWFSQPESLKFLNSERIYTLGAKQSWNEEFLKNGWKEKENFLFFKNNLQGNFNLLYNIGQVNSHNSLPLEKEKLFTDLINQGVKIDYQQKTATISAQTVKLLSAASVCNIISPYQLYFPDNLVFPKIKEIVQKDKKTNIYKNPFSLPKFYFVCSSKKLKNLAQFWQNLSEKDFQLGQTVFLNSHPEPQAQSRDKGFLPEFCSSYNKIKEIKDRGNFIHLQTENKTPALLVISQLNYPGWQAKIDGKPTPLIEANLVHQAISIPKGNHQIELKFTPILFWHFLTISVIGHLLSLALFIFWGQPSPKVIIQAHSRVFSFISDKKM